MKQSFQHSYRKATGGHMRIFLRLLLYMFFCMLIVRTSIAYSEEKVHKALNRQEVEVKKTTATKELSETKEHKGQITGFVYVTKGSGESDILRGQHIFLIRVDSLFEQERILIENVIKSLASGYDNILLTKDHTPLGQAKQYGLIGYMLGGFEALEMSLYNYYSESSFMSTRTNVNGEYQFLGLTAGSYVVYSRLITSFDVAYWLTDVTISSDSVSKLDLSNYNLVFLKKMFSISFLEQIKEDFERNVILYPRVFKMRVQEARLLFEQNKIKGFDDPTVHNFFAGLKRDKQNQ
jgi:hypothetical protein